MRPISEMKEKQQRILCKKSKTAVLKTKTSFVIDTMDYLYKGGRCTALKAFVGSMLIIHPVIHIRQESSLGVLDKVRGNQQKALRRLLDVFKTDLPNIGKGSL